MPAFGHFDAARCAPTPTLFSPVCSPTPGATSAAPGWPGRTAKARWAAAASARPSRSKLTSRLLAFSRTQSIQVEAADIDALLTSMTDWLVQSAGPGIHVDVRHGDTTLTTSTDASQLERAILNLLINSRDAMPEGGTIRIEAHEALAPEGGDEPLAPGRYVVVSVRDDGRGMSPEQVLEAEAAGARLLRKPFRPGDLVGVCRARGRVERYTPASTRRCVATLRARALRL